MSNFQCVHLLLLLILSLLIVACKPIQLPTPTPAPLTATPLPVATAPPTVEPTPSAPAADPIEVNRLLREGTQHHNAGEDDQAVDAFTKVILLRPDMDDAYVLRAASYLRLGDNKAAIADCDEAIRLNPDNADAYFYRGAAHAYSDEFEAAIVDLTEAIRLNPQSVEAHVYRGASYYFAARYADSVKDCTDAIHLSGGYFLPAEICLNVMGMMIAPDFAHFDAAIADYDRAISQDPEAAAAYLFRGLSKCVLGDMEGAIPDLEQALKLDRSLFDILLMYWSMANMHPTDPDLAIEQLETALTLVEPDSPLASMIETSLTQLRNAK